MSQYNYAFTNFFNLTSGINTVKAAIALAPNEARDAQNMDLFPIGGISKRNGYTALNSVQVGTTACTGLYMGHYSTNGGKNIAYLISGTKLYSMSSALSGTWTDATNGRSITSGQDNIWNFDILNDIVVAGNGTDTPIQIDSSGVATALSSGLPFTTFKFPMMSRGYMFYFVPTVSSSVLYDRCYFSSINDPATVGTNNFIDVGKKQGGDIRGAVDYKTFVYVFKRHGIYQLTFQPTQVDSTGTTFPWIQFPSPVVPGVGTQSHRSIVKFTTPSTHPTPGQELVFFVDQFGVPRIFDGTTTIDLSPKIADSRDSKILSLSNMDRTRAPFCWSINYPTKNRILCFMSKANSQADTCWVLDYTSGFSIMRYKFGSPFNCGAVFEKSNGTFKPFVADYLGKVYELDSGTTDDGVPIVDYYRTGDNFQGSPNLITKWYALDVRGKNGSSTQKTKVSYYVNGGDTPDKTDSRSIYRGTTNWGVGMTWGVSSWSSSGITHGAFEVDLEAKTLGVQIESLDKTNDTLVCEGFSLSGDRLGTSVD